MQLDSIEKTKGTLFEKVLPWNCNEGCKGNFDSNLIHKNAWSTLAFSVKRFGENVKKVDFMLA